MRLDQTGATPGRNAPSRALTIACAAASLGPWPVTAAMNSSRSSVSRRTSVAAGRVRVPLAGAEARELSGDPAATAQDLMRLGGELAAALLGGA